MIGISERAGPGCQHSGPLGLDQMSSQLRVGFIFHCEVGLSGLDNLYGLLTAYKSVIKISKFKCTEGGPIMRITS